MMLKKALIFSLVSTCAVLLRGQSLPFEKYTSRNGLISDRITAITQDEKGFMWFGSFFGICRYDGNRFEKIDLPPQQQNKYVNCLLAAHQKIYAGFLFGGGLAEYDRGKVKAYFIKDASISNEFICMADNGDGSIVLVNNTGHCFTFKNGNFSLLCRLPLKLGAFARHIEKDANNVYWIGTEQGLFFLPPPYNLPQLHFPGGNIVSLVKAPNNTMLFSRTTTTGTQVLKMGTNEVPHVEKATVIYTSPHIKPASFGSNGENGLWQIDLHRGLFNAISPQIEYNALPLDLTSDINAIFADREHNLWIANEPGVFKISNFNIRTYLFSEMAAAGGSMCFLNDSILLASNSKSLYSITSRGIRKIGLHPPQQDYQGILKNRRNNQLWMGFWESGIATAIMKDQEIQLQKKFSTYKGKPTKAKAIVEDGKGNAWMAGSNGLFRINDKMIKDWFQPLSKQGHAAFINCITIDEANQTLWLGDNALGIIGVRYELREDGSCHYNTVNYITAREGLKDEYTRSILFDERKNLWVGTRYGGIYRIVKEKDHYKAIDCNAAASMSCTRVTDIVSQGPNVWFASCDGVYRYYYTTDSWQHYTSSDGLLNAEVFTVAADPKGEFVWALTAQGITRLEVERSATTPPPLVHITAVEITGKPDPAALSQPGDHSYPYSKNAIGFSFAGASFIDEKKVVYKYFLEGYDKEWSKPSSSNSVRYASLPAGHYFFKVMAANARGEWSPQPAVFEFSIVLPFYQRSWFISLSIIAALLIVYTVRLQRLRQRYKIEKLRLTIARDLHDDVGSALGSINILSKTATRKLSQQVLQEEMQPIFEKIGASAENTLDAMDDIVWSINPDKDKFEDLLIRMREFAIPLFEAKNIDAEFSVDGSREQALSMNLRRNVFLVYKEAVHNILKHADANKVQISIKAEQQLVMTIKDNGRGFVPGPSQRNGLKNMQTRAREVEGILDLSSSAEGTTIIFAAPLR